MAIKVRAITNWTNSASIHHRIIQQSLCAPSDGIIFVDDDSYDWLVVFNDKRGHEIRVPRERVIGFIQEPPDHDFFDRHIGQYCSVVYTCAEAEAYGMEGNLQGFPCGMFYHMDGPIRDYLDPSIPHKKRRVVSMVTSNVSRGFYRYRVQLARRLAASGWVDVYGRGLRIRRAKGDLGNKADALMPYQFSICMENGIWADYVSDKIIDAVLCRAIPIYAGATNIKTHIPFAIELQNYRSPGDAVQEIERIISGTDYCSFVELMNEWARKYANEYTIYSKIKQTVISSAKPGSLPCP